MSSTIKKVVKLSYDQWVELLKTGKTTDKDGNEHLYDETGETSYNVYGYDELIALNNRIEEAIIRPNKVYHEQIITKKLEDEFGIKNTCRISIYFYNTKEDADKLIKALDNDRILEESLGV